MPNIIRNAGGALDQNKGLTKFGQRYYNSALGASARHGRRRCESRQRQPLTPTPLTAQLTTSTRQVRSIGSWRSTGLGRSLSRCLRGSSRRSERRYSSCVSRESPLWMPPGFVEGRRHLSDSAIAQFVTPSCTRPSRRPWVSGAFLFSCRFCWAPLTWSWSSSGYCGAGRHSWCSESPVWVLHSLLSALAGPWTSGSQPPLKVDRALELCTGSSIWL